MTVDLAITAAVWWPLVCAVIATPLGERGGRVLGLAATVGTLLCVGTLGHAVQANGAMRYPIGGWPAVLAPSLYADGLAVVMLALAATVAGILTGYACIYRSVTATEAHWQEGRSRFWPLWLLAWGGLNALFLAGDLFNAYVTLELVTLAAVGLVAQAGTRAALQGALNYLLAALAGSLLYLLGVALIYSGQGTLDAITLASRMPSGESVRWAIALMTAGLALKTALFPMHAWLPPAHASAAAPVSGLLSALVVKGSLYLLLRVWLWVGTDTMLVPLATLFGALGLTAILWGSAQAWRQPRLKGVIAYSTVAQVGYLFVAVALLAREGVAATALGGALLLVAAHALAKAAWFAAAGAVTIGAGHDRLRDLSGIARSMPLTVMAFGLAGVSLVGVPPTGGFAAKWQLMLAAAELGEWWWVAGLAAGGVMAAGYMFRVLRIALVGIQPAPAVAPVPASLQMLVMLLALAAFGLTAAAGAVTDFAAASLAPLPGAAGAQ